MSGPGGDPTKKKKRIAVTIVSSFLLIGMVIAVTVGIALSDHPRHNEAKEPSTSMKAIKNICHNTEYNDECVRSLEEEAGDTTDTKQLIQAAFRSAKKKIQEAAKKSVTIQELAKDPLTRMALDQCAELANLSISDLERSAIEVANFEPTKLDETLLDLKTWLSAAYTFQSTCLDGFEGTTGDASDKMKAALKSSMEMTTNGVTMVSDMHKALSEYNITGMAGHRRLLDDGDDEDDAVPSWVDKGTRRLLAAENALHEEKPDIVVAKDGSGKFKTINDAVKAIPLKRPAGKPFIIHIKEGVYEEQVNISSAWKNLVLIGDGPTKTRIICNRNYKQNITTYHTATLAVNANNFTAKNIGIENSAGPENHQAVALRCSGDNAVFYNCAMDGYQDTVYAHAKRQFYRDCTISGTIDFVFGNAQSIFQNCTFVVRKPMENQACIVTAQGRQKKNEPTAIVLQGCRIVADPAYYPVRFKNKAYLGRPWKEYSRTIIMHSFIDDLIAPEGFLAWQGEFALKTLVYVEHENKGPGADKSKRVKWHGIRNITPESADKFTPQNYLGGADFVMEAKVPIFTGRMPTQSH